MTVKEIMDISGKNRETVLAKIKELLPDLEIEPRKKITLDKEQAEKVIDVLMPSDRIYQKSVEKTVRIVHNTQKVELTGSLLKEMGKYLSRDEMRDFLLTAPLVNGHKLIEEKKTEQKDED